MLKNYDFLLDDPRPDLPDSILWSKLLRLAPLLPDFNRAEALHRELWGFRACGARIQRQAGGGFVLTADYDERCSFDSPEQLADFKERYLKPFAPELNTLFRKVDGYE